MFRYSSVKQDSIVILVLIIAFISVSALGIVYIETQLDAQVKLIDEPINEVLNELIYQPTQNIRVPTGNDTWNAQTTYIVEEYQSGSIGNSGGMLTSSSPQIQMDSSMSSGSRIGLAVGGANDIDNFRQNINHGYLPTIDDLTYEGIFYDYYFKPVTSDCNIEFCPAYDSWDTGDMRYVSVGLTSGITKAEFDRDGLDIVLVLDVSGSMTTGFDRYYYDRIGFSGTNINVGKLAGENDNLSKIEVAKKALIGLIDNLDYRDRLGIILFNNDAHVAKPLEYVSDIDMDRLADNIRLIIADGGTSMEDGYLAGIELFEVETFNSKRIIFLTDAMPNVGTSDSTGLSYIAKAAENAGIHTTMIGIGVDFQSKLVRDITDIRGGNYYSVHSADEFIDRMDMEFEYMVTPIVYDLRLFTNVDAEIYGAAGAQDGEIFLIKTLFPSESNKDGNKGGVILLETKSDGKMSLTATYTVADGDDYTIERTIQFDELESPDIGLLKAVLLKDYVNLMHDYINHMTHDGIAKGLSEWERQSILLTVDDVYADKIKDFMIHFENQIELLDDETLSMELDIMQKILDSQKENYIRDDNGDTWIAP